MAPLFPGSESFPARQAAGMLVQHLSEGAGDCCLCLWLSAMPLRLAANLSVAGLGSTGFALACLAGCFAVCALAAGGVLARSAILGEAAVLARGTLIGKAGYPGAPVPVPLPGPQAAGPVPVVPAHDLTVSCRVFTRVMTGMRKGQMPQRILRRPEPGVPGAAMILSAAPGLFHHGSCRSGGGE